MKTRDWKSYWNDFSGKLLSEVKAGEVLGLKFKGEESLFLRLNNSQVRQSTAVEQFSVDMNFQYAQRQLSLSFQLSGDPAWDWDRAMNLLRRCRDEVSVLPPDEFFVGLENRGDSSEEKRFDLPDTRTLLGTLIEAHRGVDQSSFYSGGPLYRANRNSLGQNHWYVTDSFFYDYSIFTKGSSGTPKAAKGTFSSDKWSGKELIDDVGRKLADLPALQREEMSLAPGSYRVFLSSSAVREIMDVLNWGAFSVAAFKQGRCPFQALGEKKETLSPLFNLRENYDLGVAPRFNSLGELGAKQIPVVSQGVLENWLVSTRSAKEYGVTSNFSDENFRSGEILSGNLPQAEALKQLGTGIAISHLHYLNWSNIMSARITGMTRYACFWVENGEVKAPIKDLRFDESLYNIFGKNLEAFTQESHLEPSVSTYGERSVGGSRVPGALLSGLSFKM